MKEWRAQRVAQNNAARRNFGAAPRSRGSQLSSSSCVLSLSGGGRWGPRQARAGMRASSSLSWCLKRRARGHPRRGPPSRRTLEAQRSRRTAPTPATWVRLISLMIACSNERAVLVHGNFLAQAWSKPGCARPVRGDLFGLRCRACVRAFAWKHAAVRTRVCVCFV